MQAIENLPIRDRMTCPGCLIGQQPADQLPWFHIVVLLIKLTAQQEREFYAVNAIEHGWSRNILSILIEARLFHREGKAITNFEKRLPSPQRIPQYVEVPPNIEAKRIISYFCAVLSY
jgi:hypothetical protein